MRFYAAIEIGRTYVDGIFEDDSGHMEGAKVETTPYDLMECLMDCINEGAKRLGIPTLRDLIENLTTVKLSVPAICYTTLTGRTGTKIGLIVTSGFQDNVYFEGEGRNPALGFLVENEMVVGIEEEVNSAGVKVLEPEVGRVRDIVRHLLESGAVAIVIGLKNASLNPTNENMIREMIESDYPKHFLGAVPVFVSTDFGYEASDFFRINDCLLNVYCWSNVADFLSKVEILLSNHKFSGVLLVAHADGGVAKTTSVTPIKTFASDQTTSISAIRKRNENFGFTHILNLGLDGDRAIATLIKEVSASSYEDFDIAGIPIRCPYAVPSIELDIGNNIKVSIDKGRIKFVTDKNEEHLVNHGLREGNGATITDAYVVLGYVESQDLVSSKKNITRGKALQRITNNIAQPLRISAEEASWEILKEFERKIANNVLEFLKKQNVGKEQLVLLPSGFNTGLHCCEIADRLNISQILYLPFSALIGAFGYADMGVAHIYETYCGRTIERDAEPQAIGWFNEKVNELRSLACRDMTEERVESSGITFSLNIQANIEGKEIKLQYPKLFLENKEDIHSLFEALSDEVAKAECVKKMKVNSLLLRASSLPELRWNEMRSGSEKKANLEQSFIGERKIYWGKKFMTLPVYEYARLGEGSTIEGLAMLQAIYDVLIIPAGRKFVISKSGDGLISKV